MIGWVPWAIPVKMEVITRDRLAITPYAATPVFPCSLRIIMLKTIITMPEAVSVIREGRPMDKIFPARAGENFTLEGWNLFFFVIKCHDKIHMLMIGAKAVARTAPSMPIWKGKIKM